jgi:hypothetical protein
MPYKQNIKQSPPSPTKGQGCQETINNTMVNIVAQKLAKPNRLLGKSNKKKYVPVL